MKHSSNTKCTLRHRFTADTVCTIMVSSKGLNWPRQVLWIVSDGSMFQSPKGKRVQLLGGKPPHQWRSRITSVSHLRLWKRNRATVMRLKSLPPRKDSNIFLLYRQQVCLNAFHRPGRSKTLPHLTRTRSSPVSWEELWRCSHATQQR